MFALNFLPIVGLVQITIRAKWSHLNFIRGMMLLILTLAPHQIFASDQITLDDAPISTKWNFILPTLVVHGIAPSDGVQQFMPQKIDSGGRSVATPGVGVEYRGDGSLDVLAAFIKDCYDNPAGTFQIGQYFKAFEHTTYGYSLGLYVRQTPITCLTETINTGGTSGRPGRPGNPNSFTTTQCGFSDNLPFRYTIKSGDNYVDIIPTPFLHFSTRLYSGVVDIDLKLMGNFYLNEFGLSFPF